MDCSGWQGRLQRSERTVIAPCLLPDVAGAGELDDPPSGIEERDPRCWARARCTEHPSGVDGGATPGASRVADLETVLLTLDERSLDETLV